MQPIVKKLLLLSAFCCLLEVFRLFATGTLNYIFLPANLFLAWIPLLFALLAIKEDKRSKLLAYSFIWLIFFPNAPYIITDLIHLKPRNDFPMWYDSILIYSHAFAGLLVGMLSAVLMYNRLKTFIPKLLARGFMLLVMLLSGYGIYVGRILRYNSWDLFTNPFQIIGDTLIRLWHPTRYPQTYGMTLITGTLLCLVFLVFETFMQKEEV